MFLHVGQNLSVKKKEIIGIFDIDGNNTPEATKDFLRRAEKNGDVEMAGYDLPKSFILTGGKSTKKVILSHISARTLVQRADLPLT